MQNFLDKYTQIASYKDGSITKRFIQSRGILRIVYKF